MRALITGATGTIGTDLCKSLSQKNIEVILWNRQTVPIDNYQLMEDFVKQVQPDVIFHLAYASKLSGFENESWKVNYEWSSELAWIARQQQIKFLFTSTNLVFSNQQQGPYTASSKPGAENGYGYEKRRAEERVIAQNTAAIVVRLGWQIGTQPGTNNMIDYLERKMNEFGEVRASTLWRPACSFLDDTCEKLIDIAVGYEPELYMIDSNERWNFYEIAKALNHLHGHRWKIIPTDDYIADNRMIDERVKMLSLNQRLHLL